MLGVQLVGVCLAGCSVLCCVGCCAVLCSALLRGGCARPYESVLSRRGCAVCGGAGERTAVNESSYQHRGAVGAVNPVF